MRSRRCARSTASYAPCVWRARRVGWPRQPARGPIRRPRASQIVGDVTKLGHAGEIKACIDPFFPVLVMLLCIAEIVTN
jgi:hypothetical protein